jgi:hypothetical protein
MTDDGRGQYKCSMLYGITEVSMELSAEWDQQLKSMDLILVKVTEGLCNNIAIRQNKLLFPDCAIDVFFIFIKI